MKSLSLTCNAYGGAEKLIFQEIELPPLSEKEVRIEVHYVGMNFPDNLVLRGTDQYKPAFPFSPCGELSGIIIEVGSSVTEVAIGDKILAGGMVYNASRTIAQVPVQNVYKIPDNMDMVKAAGLCCVYGTAIHCLSDRAQLKEGEMVAILGASGGVGMATIQIAKALGAEVIACASTEEKLAFCAAHGADHTLNYTQEDLKSKLKEISGGKGVDIVCDPVGSDHSEKALRALAWNGRFMVLGFTAGAIAHIPLNLPLLKGCQIVGVFWSTFSRKFPSQNRQNIKKVIQWHDEGKIDIHVHDIIPWCDYKRAFELLGNRSVRGKLIMSLKM